MNYIEITNCSLKKHNTLRINSTAKLMVYPLNYTGVQEIYQRYAEREIVIIGNGSNILFSKDYYDDNYVFMSFKLMDDIELLNSYIYTEAGTSLSELSWFALENGYEGFEFLEDVPGSLGGAIIMNAGTYDDNIGQLVKSVTYYDIKQDEIIDETATINDFGRRQSKWTNSNCIILSCHLSVSNNRVDNYEEIIDELLKIKKKRYLKQPRNYPNAGSVFKRPTLNGQDYYIWKLFEELNLRGHRRNGAMISKKHPGFIVNVDNAKSEDVIYLINLAKEKVKTGFGIELELEWKII